MNIQNKIISLGSHDMLLISKWLELDSSFFVD